MSRVPNTSLATMKTNETKWVGCARKSLNAQFDLPVFLDMLNLRFVLQSYRIIWSILGINFKENWMKRKSKSCSNLAVPSPWRVHDHLVTHVQLCFHPFTAFSSVIPGHNFSTLVDILILLIREIRFRILGSYFPGPSPRGKSQVVRFSFTPTS